MDTVYSDDKVLRKAEIFKLDLEPQDSLRERLASFYERVYKDYLTAWEIRTGRHRDTMNEGEAKAMLIERPFLMKNVRFLRRLGSQRK